ncbi:Outer membrane protein (porin) [Formivibrio citricus]|uniref:Outer membrane protein (Porin) n=1 Tax=Formivibrio citricus TaxID=83765 RepID=A0A1I4V8G8_9NEIS|nr:porin [Formivibrio citricus]SFM97300.1 Outer membrane protein (porin) [Formivibrio citricus]
MKKIITLAVASAFAAPTVLAEVTVYGLAAPSVEYSKISDTTSQDLTRVRLVDDVSRIGFKGTDKLDNGVKLLWQIENRVYIGTGDTDQSTGFNTRDTFVALEGNFGQVKVGSAINDLPWQSKGDYLSGLQQWNETVNGVHKSIGQSEARLNNIAQYTSPVFLGGARVKALYDFGAKTTAGNYQGLQASAMYKTQMFKVGATYKQNNDTDKTGATATTTVTPASEAFLKNYQFGGTLTPVAGLDISAMWDRNKKKASASAAEYKQDAWAIGANYTTGKHGFGIHYGKVNEQKINGVTDPDTGAYFVAAQYKYALSKQTFAHASFGHVKNDARAKLNMGTTKVTESTGTYAAINGMKVTTLVAGIATSF